MESNTNYIPVGEISHGYSTDKGVDEMRRRENGKPIIHSDSIEDIVNIFSEARRKYNECQEYLRYANDATQDILHAMELCTTNIQERNKLYTKMCEIRRKRREAKNEEAILQPIVEWIRNHDRDIRTLNTVIQDVKRIEENKNGDRFYRSRTNVIEDLFGGTSVLDVPDFEVVEESDNEENVSILNDTTIEKVLTEIDDGLLHLPDDGSPITIQYPVVLFHTRKKKSCTYYYAFPGLENSGVGHSFPSGDPTMNINNKKLLNDISISLSEIMIRKTNGLPKPVSIESINPNDIKNSIRVHYVTETRVILQEYIYTNRR